MTRDDIIQIAHDVGLHIATDVNWMPIIGLKYLEKFAALVAAAEREACAKVAQGWECKAAGDDYQTSGNGKFWDAGTDYDQGRIDAAAAIRASGDRDD